MSQQQPEESEHSVPEMKAAIPPSKAGTQKRQHHRKYQELGPGLKKPYFQLHYIKLTPFLAELRFRFLAKLTTLHLTKLEGIGAGAMPSNQNYSIKLAS